MHLKNRTNIWATLAQRDKEQDRQNECNCARMLRDPKSTLAGLTLLGANAAKKSKTRACGCNLHNSHSQHAILGARLRAGAAAMGRLLGATTSAPSPFSTFTDAASSNVTGNGQAPSAAPAHGGGGFNPVLAGVVSGLVIFFFVVGFASGYLRRRICLGYEDETRHAQLMRQRRRSPSLQSPHDDAPEKSSRALDPEIVAALPPVTFKDLPADEQAGKYSDCRVCLAVFDSTDLLKVLPQCCHAFHSACIDQWFRSHSTCPLCRASLDLATSAARSILPPQARDGLQPVEEDATPGAIRVPAALDVVVNVDR